MAKKRSAKTTTVKPIKASSASPPWCPAGRGLRIAPSRCGPRCRPEGVITRD